MAGACRLSSMCRCARLERMRADGASRHWGTAHSGQQCRGYYLQVVATLNSGMVNSPNQHHSMDPASQYGSSPSFRNAHTLCHPKLLLSREAPVLTTYSAECFSLYTIPQNCINSLSVTYQTVRLQGLNFTLDQLQACCFGLSPDIPVALLLAATRPMLAWCAANAVYNASMSAVSCCSATCVIVNSVGSFEMETCRLLYRVSADSAEADGYPAPSPGPTSLSGDSVNAARSDDMGNVAVSAPDKDKGLAHCQH